MLGLPAPCRPDRCLVMGVAQRHAGLLLRRRPLVRRRRRRRARPATARRRAPTCSTSAASRPGPAPAASPADEELRRVLPVVRGARRRRACRSASTRCAPTVAEAALAAGAALVNDVSGGLADPAMAGRGRRRRRAVRRHALARARRPTWTSSAVYDDVVADVSRELSARRRGRWSRPVSTATQVVLDPGLGFAKTAEHNWALLARPRRAARRSAARCWSAPRASGSSAAARGRRRAAALQERDARRRP